VNLRNALLATLALAPALAVADTAPAAPPAAPAAPAAAVAPAAPPFTVKWGGLVDSYYSVNLDAPQTVPSPLAGFSAAPGLRLSYAELNATIDAGPAGFRIDVGYGPTAFGTTNLLVQQAFATYKFGKVTADFGRFVTSAGAEVIEAKDNWLYTRSILFTYAIPFAHTGLRVGIPLADSLTLQLGVVNGWDDDTLTSTFNVVVGNTIKTGPHKTGNVSLTYSKDATNAAINVYAGKNAPVASTDVIHTEDATRTLVDVVLQQGFGPVSINLNLDYGHEDKLATTWPATSATWWGLAGMVRYSFTGDVARLTLRGEYFDDSKGGSRLGYLKPTDPTVGTKVYEGTLGLSFPVGGNAELRGELRYDKAADKAFPVSTDTTKAPKDSFATAQLAALAWF